MTEPSTATFNVAAGAWWRGALVLAWIAGLALQLQQPALWADAAYPAITGGGAVAILVAWRLRRGAAARLMALFAMAMLGFGYAGWRAQARLADALAPEWEGCDIEVVGVVDGMPEIAQDGPHFTFVVESARALPMAPRQLQRVARLDAAAGTPMTAAVRSAIEGGGRGYGSPSRGEMAEAGAQDDAAEAEDDASPPPATAGAFANSHPGAAPGVSPASALAAAPLVPSRIWLGWPGNQRDDHAVAATPAPLRAGQRWRIPVRLRRPHGAANPDGFDAELWLFDQGLRATGTVSGPGTLLAEGFSPIENARQWVRDRLALRGGPADATGTSGQLGPQAAGVLAALAVGDQAAVDPGYKQKSVTSALPMERPTYENEIDKGFYSELFEGLKETLKFYAQAFISKRRVLANRLLPRKNFVSLSSAEGVLAGMCWRTNWRTLSHRPSRRQKNRAVATFV